MNKFFFTLLGSVALLYASCATEIRIDPARSVITFQKAAQKSLAEDLQLHLKQITGKEIPVCPENSSPAGKFVFAVGKAPEGAPAVYQPEEARWKVTPEGVFFYGDANHGTSHAVYAFLEDELNVRWPWNHAISAPGQKIIQVKNREGCWIPQLKIREIRDYSGKKKQWHARLRAGSHNAPPYGHAFTDWWDKYGKDHPEYFALNYGKRQPTIIGADKMDVAVSFTTPMKRKIALCVSNDAVADLIIKKWGGKRQYINICENDAPDALSCHCEKCRALDALKPGEKFYHNLADRYLVFAHKILKRAKAVRPDARVSMYAYNASQDAPRRERPDKDVVLGIVPTEFAMDRIQAYVGSWKKAGMNEFYYRPNRHFYYRTPVTTGYEKHFFDLFRYLCRQNSIGFDYDSPDMPRLYDAFCDYVIFKGMQDPSRDFDYWEKHYMKAFAPAEKEVSAYFRYWREEVWEKRIAKDQTALEKFGKFHNFGRGISWKIKDYYRESDFAKAGKFLEQALERKDLSANVRNLIETLRNENEHCRLIFLAAANKTDADSMNLLKYRKEHNMPLFQGSEKYFGDICGINRVKNLMDYVPPFKSTPLFWSFKLDPKDEGIKEKWYLSKDEWKDEMATNGPWETPYPHYKNISKELRKKTAQYNGIAWYRTSVKIDPALKGRKIYLFFEAVDESCWIYVNGKLAGEHIFKKPNDWNTPFAIRIDKLIDWQEEQQTITVRVRDVNGQGGIWKPVTIVSKIR